MIVSERTYNMVGAGGQHMTYWQARKVRVEIHDPMVIKNSSGEIQEREGVFEAFKRVATDADGNRREVGCPAPVGTVKPLRYHDKDGKRRGRISVIVVDAEPYDDSGRPMWRISWERVGTKQRPIPDTSSGIYLAPEHGYTSSPARALDPEAPVFSDESVQRTIADDKSFNRELRRRRLLEMKQRTEAVTARIDAALAELNDEKAA